MYANRTAAAAALIVLALSLGSEIEAPRLERIEWSDVWIVNADRDEGSRVLLAGDSIVSGYYSAVEQALSGKADCSRYATSKFLGNPDYLAELGLILNRYRFDVVHINNGLHGWDYTEEEYRQGLQELLGAVKRWAPDAVVIWCMTTPMRQAGNLSELDADKNVRILERNRIAAEVMREQNIPVNDLYDAVKDSPALFAADGVHYNSEGKALLGKLTAAAIEARLPESGDHEMPDATTPGS